MAAGTEAKKFKFAQVLKPNMQLNGPKCSLGGPDLGPGRSGQGVGGPVQGEPVLGLGC